MVYQIILSGVSKFIFRQKWNVWHVIHYPETGNNKLRSTSIPVHPPAGRCENFRFPGSEVFRRNWATPGVRFVLAYVLEGDAFAFLSPNVCTVVRLEQPSLGFPRRGLCGRKRMKLWLIVNLSRIRCRAWGWSPTISPLLLYCYRGVFHERPDGKGGDNFPRIDSRCFRRPRLKNWLSGEIRTGQCFNTLRKVEGEKYIKPDLWY